MSENYIFITPGDNLAVRPFEPEIASAYKTAFAGEPWFEKTKCADKLLRCAGGLSPIEIGDLCTRCGETPSQEAYNENELTDTWRRVAANRPAAWYLELYEGRVALAGFFWQADAKLLADEKYPDVPEMSEWLGERFGDEPFVWLDEMFANKVVRQSANLQRFEGAIDGIRDILGLDRLAYRTITPQMKRAALRLGVTPLKALSEVPDRRDFIDIVRKTS